MRKVHQPPDVRLFYCRMSFYSCGFSEWWYITVLQDVIVFIDFMNTNRKLSAHVSRSKNIRRKKRSYGILFSSEFNKAAFSWSIEISNWSELNLGYYPALGKLQHSSSSIHWINKWYKQLEKNKNKNMASPISIQVLSCAWIAWPYSTWGRLSILGWCSKQSDGSGEEQPVLALFPELRILNLVLEELHKNSHAKKKK